MGMITKPNKLQVLEGDFLELVRKIGRIKKQCPRVSPGRVVCGFKSRRGHHNKYKSD